MLNTYLVLKVQATGVEKSSSSKNSGNEIKTIHVGKLLRHGGGAWANQKRLILNPVQIQTVQYVLRRLGNSWIQIPPSPYLNLD